MQFGFFDNQKREYVISEPQTPLPWINYLGSQNFCRLISNTGGGYSFHTDPRDRRLTRYRYNNVPLDQSGHYIYIRNNKNGEFFSPTWQPVQKKLDKYECRHGLGYTTITSEYKGIKTTATYFVPLGEDCEVWMVEIESKDKKKALDLSVFSYVEFCLWDAVGDSTNFQRTLNIGQAQVEGSTIYHTTLYESWVDILGYFSVNKKINGFDTERSEFLGNNGYNSLAKPEAVSSGKCKNSKAYGGNPIGTHQINLTLKKGKSDVLIFTLGTAKDKKKAQSVKNKFNNKKSVLKELDKLRKHWQVNLSHFNAETPDQDMNTMLNTWNQYQCQTTFNWSRYASYFESGIGRGMGFRDCNQDILGFVHMLPKESRERILDLAALQFERGDCYHQYSPITKKGSLWGYSDDHLWLISSTVAYIKETGDLGILEKKVPFAKFEPMVEAQKGHHDHIYKEETPVNGKGEKRFKMASLFEHLNKAIEFSWKNVGPHGLPKAGFADWNDCLNMTGKRGMAESVLVAMMLVAVCRKMIHLCQVSGHAGYIKKYEQIVTIMTQRINKYAWDGNWWRRAYNDKGTPIGSSKAKEGKIYLETQPWAIMSEVADRTNATTCLDQVRKHLYTKYGIMLQSPAMTRYYSDLGEISTYPAGLKENGSVFCHPNPWVVIAEAILGRGNLAFEYYKAILPAAQNTIAEIRKVEPYVYCQMVAGKNHPEPGEGKNSWLTGSASWNFVAAAEYILGVRPSYNGLIVDPCIPKSWKSFKVTRVFRGATYQINVMNPFRKNKGVKQIKVDGKRIHSILIPIFNDKKTHKVDVVMG